MQAALGLLAAAALGLPNRCERPAGPILCVYGVYNLYFLIVHRRVTSPAWRVQSVIEWVTRRSDLLSSGAEGAEQLGGCLGTAQFWDCWVWEQRWVC